jgi:hypothetical protein
MEKGGKVINCRGTFISNIINKMNYSSYLEIGLSHNPKAPYRMIEIEDKTSVDMDPATGPDYCMASDVFFEKLKSGETDFDKEHKWDVAFIDGNHLAYQVYNDLCNAFDHLKDDGIIFLHDVLPWHYDMTIESAVSQRAATCQDAWKVIEYCLKNREDMDVCTLLESGGGIGIIKKRSSPRQNMLDKNYNRFYQYCVYETDTKNKMNCISESDVIEWINEKEVKYNF